MQELSVIVSRGHKLKGPGLWGQGGREEERIQFQKRRECLARKQGESGKQPAAGQFVLGWAAADTD